MPAPPSSDDTADVSRKVEEGASMCAWGTLLIKSSLLSPARVSLSTSSLPSFSPSPPLPVEAARLHGMFHHRGRLRGLLPRAHSVHGLGVSSRTEGPVRVPGRTVASDEKGERGALACGRGPRLPPGPPAARRWVWGGGHAVSLSAKSNVADTHTLSLFPPSQTRLTLTPTHTLAPTLTAPTRPA